MHFKKFFVEGACEENFLRMLSMCQTILRLHFELKSHNSSNLFKHQKIPEE
jgi:hypothetical protein